MYVCSRCDRKYDFNRAVWSCECGGNLDLEAPVAFDAEQVDRSEPGLWRYSAAMPHVPSQSRIRLGETVTPLVESSGLGARVKVDYLFPSGSFKDRGSAVLISRLNHLGVREVIEDSSGNAGASIAAYCASARIGCRVFVPANNSANKLAQIEAYGATLVPIEGDRAAVQAAAWHAARLTFYASHNRHPDFLAGVSTLGFEIWEQLGHRAPTALVVPCGQGSLVLGLHRAFEALLKGRAISRLPKIFAIQAQAFDAVARAWARGLAEPEVIPTGGTTIAEGIVTRQPLRGAAVLRAIRDSGGKAISVSEAAIRRGLKELVTVGMYAEPTSATAVAGLHELEANGDVRKGTTDTVLVLTGSGLKAGTAMVELTRGAALSS